MKSIFETTELDVSIVLNPIRDNFESQNLRDNLSNLNLDCEAVPSQIENAQ